MRSVHLALLLVVTGACALRGGTINPRPTQTVRPLAIHTCVANAAIDIDGALVAAQRGTTDTAGNWPIPAVSSLVTAFNLHLLAPGYVPYMPVVPLPAGNVDFFVGACGQGSFTADAHHIVLPALIAIDLPRLVAEGTHFRLANGERITIIEATDFQLFQRFLAGENLEPILADRAGFNMLRVFSTCDFLFRLYPQEHLNYYSQLVPFAQLLAAHGFYLELTVFADATRVFPLQSDQLRHWDAVINALRDQSSVIIELVNESDQSINAIRTDVFPRPMGILASHGSNGSEAVPVQPYWNVATFHTNDASEWWRKTGHNAWEIWTGPTLANENTRPDHDPTVTHFYDAAAGGALLAAGSCFHSIEGRTDLLFSPETRRFANAWIAGARSVPLICQDGQYRHREDLEGPNDLRVYQRGDTPMCVVSIRK